MTKLEEDIHTKILAVYHEQDTSLQASAKAAAEVAKEYIEKAMKDSLAHGYQMFGMETKSYQSTYIEPFRSQWLKDNGITE